MFKTVIIYLLDHVSKQINLSRKNVNKVRWKCQNMNDNSKHANINILVNHVYGRFLTGKQLITEHEARHFN